MNSIKRRRIAIGILSTIVAITASVTARAQTGSGYLKGVVRIVVTNAPGTAPDVIGRTLAQGMVARPGTSEAFVKLIQFDYARNKIRIVVEPAAK